MMEEEVLRPFELMIIRRFKSFSPEGGGQAAPRKGVWIRSHLMEVREDYVYSMWKRWQHFVKQAWERGARIKPGDYTTFKTYIWLLTRLKLITPTRRRRGKSPKILRQYYTYNSPMLKDPAWENPLSDYDSWKKQKAKGFPRPKKKRELKWPE